MKNKIMMIVTIFILMLKTSASYGQFLNNVSIHGFGGWAYGITDNENRYLMGNKDGNYDFMNFSLNMSADLHENLSVYAQPSFCEEFNKKESRIDYAFAQWYASDKLIFRIGKVKMPFMSYNEVYDVGTIRPFFMLPQGVYREFSTESYKGAGITGNLYSDNDWEVFYDLYGGKGELEPQRELWELYLGEGMSYYQFVDVVYFGDDLIGGRLSMNTPKDGLALSCSYYSVNVGLRIDEFNFSQKMNERYHFGGLSLEYLSEKILIRGEYAGRIAKEGEEGDKMKSFYNDTAYLESAYKLTEKWQITGRFEYENEADDEPSDFEKHKEFGVGVNYWFNPNLVIKISSHFVKGNIFAQPDQLKDYIKNEENNSFDNTTALFLVGTQFSF